MQFLIVTPSLNTCDRLRQCVPSVSDGDAKGLAIRHFVQDGNSVDGSAEFLKCHQVQANSPGETDYSFGFAIELDKGMYDAINKGVEQLWGAKRPDSIFAWLNCDEQYLPGTLEKVSLFFRENPSIDILFGGMIVVDENGGFLSCRKAIPMRKPLLQASYLYNFSCATFFRASFWEKMGGFDTSFKNAGDEDLMRRALELGAKTEVFDEYLATFTYGGGNLSSDPAAMEEHSRLKALNPRWVNWFRVPINLLRLIEKLICGGHHQKGPLSYEIYVDDLERRTRFIVEQPTCRWPDESRPYLTGHRLRS